MINALSSGSYEMRQLQELWSETSCTIVYHTCSYQFWQLGLLAIRTMCTCMPFGVHIANWTIWHSSDCIWEMCSLQTATCYIHGTSIFRAVAEWRITLLKFRMMIFLLPVEHCILLHWSDMWQALLVKTWIPLFRKSEWIAQLICLASSYKFL